MVLLMLGISLRAIMQITTLKAFTKITYHFCCGSKKVANTFFKEFNRSLNRSLICLRGNCAFLISWTIPQFANGFKGPGSAISATTIQPRAATIKNACGFITVKSIIPRVISAIAKKVSSIAPTLKIAFFGFPVTLPLKVFLKRYSRNANMVEITMR